MVGLLTMGFSYHRENAGTLGMVPWLFKPPKEPFKRGYAQQIPRNIRCIWGWLLRGPHHFPGLILIRLARKNPAINLIFRYTSTNRGLLTGWTKGSLPYPEQPDFCSPLARQLDELADSWHRLLPWIFFGSKKYGQGRSEGTNKTCFFSIRRDKHRNFAKNPQNLLFFLKDLWVFTSFVEKLLSKVYQDWCSENFVRYPQVSWDFIWRCRKCRKIWLQCSESIDIC